MVVKKAKLPLSLEAPLSELSGVGPARAAALARLGLNCARDLLCLAPRKLLVLGDLMPIAQALTHMGARVSVRGHVDRMQLIRGGGRRRSLLRLRLVDDSGEINLLFFNQPWLRERFKRGDGLGCAGQVVQTTSGVALASPRILGDPGGEGPQPGDLEVEYGLTEGIGQALLRKLAGDVLRDCADQLEERIDARFLNEFELLPMPEAVRALHQPRNLQEFDRGRRRLLMETMLTFQARIAARRAARGRGRARALPWAASAQRDVEALFPFDFTRDQRRAVAEIAEDLSRTVPMRRLLQGDVGSGKTAVAASALLAALRSGVQAAFLAPTALLAEQHARSLGPLFRSAGAELLLLTGSMGRAARSRVLAQIGSGGACVVVGTHALMSKDVGFAGLGLVVIDEQHRFGVAQRRRLLTKGEAVHALLMTATPIPRTLAQTLYGDFDLSSLRSMPPGRGSLETRRVPRARRAAMLRYLLERVRNGERVFWVVPRIEGEGGAEAAFAQLRRGPLAEFGIELVHGRLDAKQREARLDRFRAGTARTLVSTTVVEVGVDIPTATVMVIADAHRLGLAQLHQLRGRVGRGSLPSYCLLLGGPRESPRLERLVSSRDGFALAEFDLEERGMGELLGLRQAGFGALLDGALGAAEPDGLPALEGGMQLFELAGRILAGQPELADCYGAAGEAAGPATGV